MNSRLKARIYASLRGRRKEKQRSRALQLIIASLRAGLVVTALAVAVSYFLKMRGHDAQMSSLRAELLATHEKASSGLGATEKDLQKRSEKALFDALEKYEGDFFGEEMRDQALLSKQLERPGVYLRGEIDDLKKQDGVKLVAEDSLKDAFLVCMLDPPPGIEEKQMLERVYVAYRSGPTLDEATDNFHRLQAGLAFLPLLEDSWREKVRRATKLSSLRYLKKTLEQAPLEKAISAARSEIFLFLLDEEKEKGSPSEFDGSCKHFVQIHMVELKSQRTLLRARLPVNPEWVSEGRRHRYAAGLLGCRLAKELRDRLSGKTLQEVPKDADADSGVRVVQ